MSKVLIYSIHRSGTNVLAEILEKVCQCLKTPYYTSNKLEHYDAIIKESWQGFIHNRTGCFGPIRIGEANPCVPYDSIDDKYIVHIRDPRDVLVSLYFQLLYVTPDISGGGGMSKADIEQWRDAGIDKYVLAAADKVKQRYQYISTCILPLKPTILHYEQMVTDFSSWLSSLLETFSSDVSDQSELDRLHQEICLSYQHSFSATTENHTLHKRQIRPGDHHRKLKAATIRELNIKLKPVLEAFDYNINPKLFKIPTESFSTLDTAARKYWNIPATIEWEKLHTSAALQADPNWVENQENAYWSLVNSKNASSEGDFAHLHQAMAKIAVDVVTLLDSFIHCGDCYVQSFFSPRFIIPGSLGAPMHHDDRLPDGTLNILIFLSAARGSNALWLEVESAGVQPLKVPAAKTGPWALVFDAKKLLHGSQVNTSNNSRISFDLRVLPVSCYCDDDIKVSPSGRRFCPGDAFCKEPVSPIRKLRLN